MIGFTQVEAAVQQDVEGPPSPPLLTSSIIVCPKKANQPINWLVQAILYM